MSEEQRRVVEVPVPGSVPRLGYHERFEGAEVPFLRWVDWQGSPLDVHPMAVRVQDKEGTNVDGHLLGVHAIDGVLYLAVRMDWKQAEHALIRSRRSAQLREIMLADDGGDYLQTAGADPYWIAWPLSGRVRLYTDEVTAPKRCASAGGTGGLFDLKLDQYIPNGAYHWSYQRFQEGARVVELHPLAELDA